MQQQRKLMGTFRKFFKILNKSRSIYLGSQKSFSSFNKPAVILGIETTFDDTGIAIVDSTGKILGDALNSQLTFHLGEGGINPPVAKDLHKANIDKVYEECLQSANLELKDVDAIAVAVEPGLIMSLKVGREFALNLSKIANKPLIPIHHMQAHALTARMIEKVDYPFLTLLVSGAHCLLALVQSVDDFKILGETSDDAPGEAFDKVSRRMKLMNIFEYNEISGGKAIELAAKKADNPEQFDFPFILAHYRDCNFSFSGIKTKAMRHIISQEEKFHVSGTDIIPDYNNLCASFLMSITKHLCNRTQRSMEFINRKNLIPEEKRTLVVSGGVAANSFLANALKKVCLELGFKFVKPPPKLCTDNGIMIAWNGVERYIADKGVLRERNEIEKVAIAHRKPMGESWSEIVANEGIKPKWVKLNYNELVDQ